MVKFTVLNSLVMPLDRANVDTDQIIPKQYLSSIKRTGFAEGLFGAWRKDPQFVLNQARFKGAQILLGRENFGCGSSREHAPWALLDFGIRCVIASSFADIFYNNWFQNGILPIKLPQEDVDKLMDDANRGANATITIDLEKQEIRGPDGGCVRFEMDPFRKRCLQQGEDDIGLALAHALEIHRHEEAAQRSRPWAFMPVHAGRAGSP